MTQQKKKDGLNIELTEEVAQGAYSNLAIINHSPSEFVVDFIQMMPGVAKAKVKSRVILTPQHAKRLMKALVENIKKFENPEKLLLMLSKMRHLTGARFTPYLKGEPPKSSE